MVLAGTGKLSSACMEKGSTNPADSRNKDGYLDIAEGMQQLGMTRPAPMLGEEETTGTFTRK